MLKIERIRPFVQVSFFVIFLFLMLSGKAQLWMGFIFLSAILAAFISEKAWHRYLCPWGTLFSLTARFSKYGMNQDKCTKCSLCAKYCPGDAIVIDIQKGAVVDSKNCLLCFECKNTCPISSFNYQSK